MRFTFPDGQFRYFSPSSIVRTLGLRNSGRRVSLLKLAPKDRQTMAQRIRSTLGITTRKHARDGGLSINVVEAAISRMKSLDLDERQTRAFEMAFSLLAAGTYVGPRQSYTTIPWEMLGCVLREGGTGQYDLAEWAFEIIRSSVKKLHQDLEAGVRTLIVGGCHLALLPWFFDWMDYGPHSVEANTVPRISVYTEERCKRLIYLTREYPTIFSTKPLDHFNPQDDVWHDVVGEPGGILKHGAQLDALRAAQGLIAANQQPFRGSAGAQGEQQHGIAPGPRDPTSVATAKGKGLAAEISDSSSSDSDDGPVDPSVRLARTMHRAEIRGVPLETPRGPTSISIANDVGATRVTGPRSMNRLRRRLHVSGNGEQDAGAGDFFTSVWNPSSAAMLRSRGETL